MVCRALARRIWPTACAHLVAALPALAVASFTGADFARAYAGAVESRGVPAWREACRRAALFVLDNLDELAEKPAAQIELLHTIDALVDTGAHVVLTARRQPTRIPGLYPALAGRLSAGLVIRVAAPGAAARLALLRTMASMRELSIDDDALERLSVELAVTAPELSGALFDLAAQLKESRVPAVDVRTVLSYLKSRGGMRRAAIRDITAHVARHYALRVADLRGPSRRKNIAAARALAMYVARKLTAKSYGAVGKYFGGRDHTTVLHGCRKTEELLAHDAGLRQIVRELESRLGCG